MEMTKNKKFQVVMITTALVSYLATVFAWYYMGQPKTSMPLPILYVFILGIGMMGLLVGMRATYWVKVQPLLVEINELKEKLGELEEK